MAFIKVIVRGIVIFHRFRTRVGSTLINTWLKYELVLFNLVFIVDVESLIIDLEFFLFPFFYSLFAKFLCTFDRSNVGIKFFFRFFVDF